MRTTHDMKFPLDTPRRRERGAALIVSLVLLLVVTVLGVTAMRTSTLQERMAGNLRDNNLAFQAAEAALREGEAFLEQAALPPFTGANGLLLQQADAGQADFWSSYAWGGASRAATRLDGIAATAESARYVIEELPPVPVQGDSLKFAPLPDIGIYRVTAMGVGGTTDAVVIVQTTYRR